MAQASGLVAIRIPHGNLVEALPHLFAPIMVDFARIPCIGEQCRKPFTQS